MLKWKSVSLVPRLAGFAAAGRIACLTATSLLAVTSVHAASKSKSPRMDAAFCYVNVQSTENCGDAAAPACVKSSEMSPFSQGFEIARNDDAIFQETAIPETRFTQVGSDDLSADFPKSAQLYFKGHFNPYSVVQKKDQVSAVLNLEFYRKSLDGTVVILHRTRVAAVSNTQLDKLYIENSAERGTESFNIVVNCSSNSKFGIIQKGDQKLDKTYMKGTGDVQIIRPPSH